jgi:hypothetical protein
MRWFGCPGIDPAATFGLASPVRRCSSVSADAVSAARTMASILANATGASRVIERFDVPIRRKMSVMASLHFKGEGR